ncbi:MAG: polyprenyl synthetase family protein [Pirellulaceae bacterium]
MPESAANPVHFDVETARAKIDEQLESYTEFDADCPDQLREAIRYSLLSPGKRLRPLLVLMACDACGGDWINALPAACAVEMVHTYSLIHDDLPSMDDDQLRRGQPTCHVKFGEATAILAGDALIPLAFQVVCSEYPPSLATPCSLQLATACGATRLVGGQADDLSQQNGSGDLEELENIHRRKTGALLTVSLRLGGIVAGANADQLAALESFGKRLGLAFQIVDDLLDCHGDWTKMGKMTNKDTDRGKLTYPNLLGMDESKDRAESLIAEATAALAGFGDAANPLRSLARFVLERNQ